MTEPLGIRLPCSAAGPFNQFRTSSIALAGSIAVCLDILSGDVGAELLISVRCAIQNERALGLLIRIAEFFSAQEQAELERHVEPREAGDAIELDPRDVMNRVLGTADDPYDLLKADVARVLNFQR